MRFFAASVFNISTISVRGVTTEVQWMMHIIIQPERPRIELHIFLQVSNTTQHLTQKRNKTKKGHIIEQQSFHLSQEGVVTATWAFVETEIGEVDEKYKHAKSDLRWWLKYTWRFNSHYEEEINKHIGETDKVRLHESSLLQVPWWDSIYGRALLWRWNTVKQYFWETNILTISNVSNNLSKSRNSMCNRRLNNKRQNRVIHFIRRIFTCLSSALHFHASS